MLLKLLFLSICLDDLLCQIGCESILVFQKGIVLLRWRSTSETLELMVELVDLL